MAYPASQKIQKDALDGINSVAIRLRRLVQSLRNDSAAGDTPRLRYVSTQRQIQLALDSWDEDAAVPGLAEYAQDQYNDPTLDLVAEYTTMRTAAIDVQAWIFGAIPTDAGSGAALLEIYDSQGNPTNIMTTTAQASGFRTVADIFLASVV